MTKSELIDKMWADLGSSFTKAQITLLVNEVFNQIEKNVFENKPVKILNFGTFSLYKKKPTVRNLPTRQEIVQIPSRYKLKFIPSQTIIKKLLRLK